MNMTDIDIEKLAKQAGVSFNVMKFRLKHVYPHEALAMGQHLALPDLNVYVWDDEKWTVEELADWAGVTKEFMRDKLINHSVEELMMKYKK